MNKELKDTISINDKKDRVKKLMDLSLTLENNYYNKFKGQKLDVLIEEVFDDYSVGHTSNYLMVKIPKKLVKGEIYNEKI